MKINILIFIILLFTSCQNTQPQKIEFDNSVCLEFVNQSGYPQEICDCVKNDVQKISNINEITYENIEKLVDDCVQSNFGMGF